MDFLKIKSKTDLCSYLQIKVSELNYLLYSKVSKYRSYNKKKKHGGVRIIDSPNRQLKYVQRKLKSGFEEYYSKNNKFDFVHGFIENKSIRTNAACHVNKKYLLNVDIEDFFPSITFNRIHGLLTSSKAFNFPNKVAIMIANLVTKDGKLPQGAPTSPIISNIICHNLDKYFKKMMHNSKIIYSRYADDITFSSDDKQEMTYIYSFTDKNVNDKIIDVFEKNGFHLNKEKTRLSTYYNHQEVTGITINKKLNVNKHFIYKLRTMIHSWYKFGLINTYKRFCEKKDIEFNENDIDKYRRVVLGMLSYLKMVKGYDDQQYVRLAKTVNKLLECTTVSYKSDYYTIKNESVYQIYNKMTSSLGTCFRIKKYYVTCRHCIHDEENEGLDVYKISKKHDIIEDFIKPVYVSQKHDFALFDAQENTDYPYINLASSNPEPKDIVSILGYPMADEYDNISEQTGQITGEQHYDFKNVIPDDYYVVAASIQSGNSGGPVLNKDGDLIGMVCLGNSDNACNLKNGILKLETIKAEIKAYEQSKVKN